MYIPEAHMRASLAYEQYLKDLKARASQLPLIICGTSSDAHVQACRHLLTWAREHRNLESLKGTIEDAILQRLREKAHDARQIRDPHLVQLLTEHHETFIGVYQIALEELAIRYGEFAKIAEKERKRTQEAFSQSA